MMNSLVIRIDVNERYHKLDRFQIPPHALFLQSKWASTSTHGHACLPYPDAQVWTDVIPYTHE